MRISDWSSDVCSSTASTPSLARRLGPSQSLSSTQTMPVSSVSSDRMVAKSHCTVCMICVPISVEPLLLLFLDAQHREECFLRNLDGADLLHALLAFLLLFKKLLLARSIATVALGGDRKSTRLNSSH